MKLVDANVLIHAVNPHSPEHRTAKSWLDNALSGGSAVGFDWLALVAFVRLTSNAAIFERPLTPDEAMGQVASWLSAKPATVLQPKPSHPATMLAMLAGTGGGTLTNDAHLAALAHDHKATVVSFDSDFSRFPGVRWERPS